MKLFETIKIALKNIASNKLRSALTMLGLIIGIASVIILVGIGKGASSSVQEQVKSLGTDILTISINSSDSSLEYSSLEDILKIDNVSSVSPYKNVSATVSRGTTTANSASIIATNDEYLDVTNLSLYEGRKISIIDIENSSKICIIGQKLATTLFSLSDPIGETIKIDGDNYTVVGMLEESGTSMGNNIDNMLIIPITTAKYLGTDTAINNLYVKIEDEENVTTATAEIKTIIKTISKTGEIKTGSEEKLELHASYYFKEILIDENQYVAEGENILEYTNGTYLTAPYNCVITGISVPNKNCIVTNKNYIAIKGTDTLETTLSVDEDELDTVYVGQEAQITVSALENKVYNGYVTKISNTATYSSNGSNFAITVEFNNDGNALIGMTAKTEVILEKAENVLVVPVEAIEENSNQKYVTVVNKDGTTSEKNVETGISNDAYIEIKSGLSEGDSIQITVNSSSLKNEKNHF